jgi:hypothetical protein
MRNQYAREILAHSLLDKLSAHLFTRSNKSSTKRTQ